MNFISSLWGETRKRQNKIPQIFFLLCIQSLLNSVWAESLAQPHWNRTCMGKKVTDKCSECSLHSSTTKTPARSEGCFAVRLTRHESMRSNSIVALIDVLQTGWLCAVNVDNSFSYWLELSLMPHAADAVTLSCCVMCVPAGGIQGRGHQLAQHRLHRQHRLHQSHQQEAHSAVPPPGWGVQVSRSASLVTLLDWTR